MGVLRWMAVLPAACTGYLVAMLVLGLVEVVSRVAAAMQFFNDPVVVPGWMFYLALQGAKTYMFIVAGAMTAPAYNLGTAIVLTMIMTVVAIISAMAGASIAVTDLENPHLSPVFHVLGAFVAFAACVGACLNVREMEDESARVTRDLQDTPRQ